MTRRYRFEELRALAVDLLLGLGLPADPARTVADILLEGDLLGHTTHGLQLLDSYLKALEEGSMTKEGEPVVLEDRGASLFWDGCYLPGPWLVSRAIDLGFERLKVHPTFSACIKQSHHIACLAAYLQRVTEQGYLIILASSDPTLGSKVAPFGSRTPVYTPNPIAAGWPTDSDPVMMDISMSTTSIGLCSRLNQQGGRLPGQWLLDSDGRPTDDPAVIFRKPSGSLLPLGGLDLGYKGFALGLLVEALTSGLCGFGRKDRPGRWGATVFLLLVNPDAFGGFKPFLEETSWLAQACRQAEPLQSDRPVRLPGQGGLAKKRRYLKSGVELNPGILPALAKWSDKLGVPLPEPMA